MEYYMQDEENVLDPLRNENRETGFVDHFWDIDMYPLFWEDDIVYKDSKKNHKVCPL